MRTSISFLAALLRICASRSPESEFSNSDRAFSSSAAFWFCWAMCPTEASSVSANCAALLRSASVSASKAADCSPAAASSPLRFWISVSVSACCCFIAPKPRSKLSSRDFFSASFRRVSDITAYFWSFVSRSVASSSSFAAESDFAFSIVCSACASCSVADFSLSSSSKREFSISASCAVLRSASAVFSASEVFAASSCARIDEISRLISTDTFLRFSMSASAASSSA